MDKICICSNVMCSQENRCMKDSIPNNNTYVASGSSTEYVPPSSPLFVSLTDKDLERIADLVISKLKKTLLEK